MGIRRTRAAALAVVSAAVLTACGGGQKSEPSATTTRPSATAPTPAGTTTASTTAQPPAIDELSAAGDPRKQDFPAADGRSLRQLGKFASVSATLGNGNGTFTPGV